MNNDTYRDDIAGNEELRSAEQFVENRKNYPDYFADWQVECLEDIKDKQNVILSSPTGSGKTTVFMEWAKLKQAEAEQNGRQNTTYITAPIKALSNQRFRELQEQGYKVGIETGDIKVVPEDADFICCTQEIYTNKYYEDADATLIVDEFHYIFEDSERSRAYIDGIHNAKAENVLLCSATFGDIEKLDNYVEKVTGRDFKAYENHDRLTELSFGGNIAKEDIADALIITFSAGNCESIADELADARNSKGDVSKIKEICKKYNVNYDERMGSGICTYYGKKLPKAKLCIEELFEERLIDTVVGTDALALGVNFPVDKVVFSQLAKYYDGPISKNLFDQLAGRAGRKGYFDHGTVYYCEDFTGSNGYPVEARGYDTKQLYYDYVDKLKNEDVQILLAPSVKRVLNGEATMDEEASYVSRFSTELVDEEDVKADLEDAIDTLLNEPLFDYDDLTPEEKLYVNDSLDKVKAKEVEFNPGKDNVLTYLDYNGKPTPPEKVYELEVGGEKYRVYKGLTLGAELSRSSFV